MSRSVKIKHEAKKFRSILLKSVSKLSELNFILLNATNDHKNGHPSTSRNSASYLKKKIKRFEL